MFTLTINVPQDVLQAGNGTVQAALYGQLLAAYTPSAGPSSGTALQAEQWVYFTGSGYAAVSPNGTVPAFGSWTTAGAQQVALPDVQVQAAHVVFGIGALPTISVDGTGAPQQPDPVATQTVFDFVEFTYNLQNVLYINTTMIDQFGFPIQIQVDPPAAVLPNGAGVTADRATVFSQYQQYATGANAAFLQCAQDAFGNPLATRILSPKNALVGSAPQGVVANVFTGPTSTLPAGSYYYAVTALNGASPAVESCAQPFVVQAAVTALGQAVNVAWAPNSAQPAGTASYNVYRGTSSGSAVTWGLIGSMLASQFLAGGAFADTGQAATSQSPPQNPLASWFDSQIQAFFSAWTNPPSPLTLTATDGTNDGYVYTFQGTTTTDAGGSACLQFLLTGVTFTTPSGVVTPVTDPPIPLQTPFNVYYPYWSTNTYDASNPAPPSWTVYPSDSASTMVFAAEGVFADNAAQSASNLPSQVPPANATIYGTLLGALENQVVAALTRGIANSATLSPQNWGNNTAPVQLTPTLVSSDPGAAGTQSALTSGTTYYYVITAVNTNGETIGSFEFNATPTSDAPFVQLNWQPVSTSVAQSFNVYRGTASQQENVLANASPILNDGSTGSWTDNGSSTTTRTPPSYFPAGIPASAYDSFFHQPVLSLNGAAYAGPYDDQGGQSSTLATPNPVSATITLGPWG